MGKLVRVWRFFAVFGVAACCLACLPADAGLTAVQGRRAREIAQILYGRIKVVDSGADFTVYVVQSGEDLRVRAVSDPTAARQPGRWYFVKDFGQDYTVKFVSYGGDADLRVRFVDSGEGL